MNLGVLKLLFKPKIFIFSFTIFYFIAITAFGSTNISDSINKTRTSIDQLTVAVDGLPLDVQNSIGGEIKFLGQEINLTLDKIQKQSIPSINQHLGVDIEHVGLLSKLLTNQLNGIKDKKNAKRIRKLKNNVNYLFVMLGDLQTELQGGTEEWERLTEGTVAKLEKSFSGLVLYLIDWRMFNIVRLVCALLLLVGLFIVGLRLFDLSYLSRQNGKSTSNSSSKVFSTLIILLFFLLTLLVGLKPELILKDTSEKIFYPRQSNCMFYRRYLTHLERASIAKIPELISIVERKVEEEKMNCFYSETQN